MSVAVRVDIIPICLELQINFLLLAVAEPEGCPGWHWTPLTSDWPPRVPPQNVIRYWKFDAD